MQASRGGMLIKRCGQTLLPTLWHNSAGDSIRRWVFCRALSSAPSSRSSRIDTEVAQSPEPTADLVRSDVLTAAEKDAFWHDGYVVLPQFLPTSTVSELRDVFPRLFAGHFPTGVYPDEWHWREGLSLPSASREICNAWKSDPVVRRVVFSEAIGRLVADLMAWEEGTRIGQDSVLWKPAGGSAVGFHQDSRYISEQFEPLEDNSVTLWMAIDDADDGNGCVEYANGSHRWSTASAINKGNVAQEGFHGSSDAHDAAVFRAAEKCGIDVRDVAISGTTVPVGGAILHHQDTWHGSGPNKSGNRLRRALVGHYIRSDVKFRRSPPPTYIYGRYKLADSLALHETFFPTTYTPQSS